MHYYKSVSKHNRHCHSRSRVSFSLSVHSVLSIPSSHESPDEALCIVDLFVSAELQTSLPGEHVVHLPPLVLAFPDEDLALSEDLPDSIGLEGDVLRDGLDDAVDVGDARDEVLGLLLSLLGLVVGGLLLAEQAAVVFLIVSVGDFLFPLSDLVFGLDPSLFLLCYAFCV